MGTPFDDALRSTTALQVAIYELASEPVTTKAKDSMALPALSKCLEEVNAAVKRLKKIVYT